MTTTALTSTGTCQTHNLTVPSTQNTAPVLEFRCLYSHDLRRKQKRWQDGLLRFHTFNKRIMVYDVPRNYIGDTHYRDDGILQDGDELELDRGILIQVGENTGSMEQDLTELLEKKRKPQESAPYKDGMSSVKECPAIATARPVMGPPSQLRPKSLNALLGTPKRSIGRASLPTKSPHEIRQESQGMALADERPAKRQRLSFQSKQLAQEAAIPAIQITTLSRPPGKSIIRRDMAVDIAANEEPLSPHVPISKEVENRDLAIDTNSRQARLRGRQNYEWKTTESRQKMATSKQPRDGVTLRNANQLASQEAYDGGGPSWSVEPIASKHQNPVSRTAKAISSRSLQDGSTSQRMEPAMKPIDFNSGTETFATCKPPKEQMRLKIASRKPRQKLMYGGLLPEDPPATGRPSSDRALEWVDSRESGVSAKSSKGPKDLSSKLHLGEVDRLAVRVNRHHRHKYHGFTEDNAVEDDRVHSPGLFLSQEDDPNLAASCPKAKGGKEKIDEGRSRGQHVGDIADHVHLSRSLDIREETIPKKSSTNHDPELTLSKTDEVLFSGTLHNLSDPRNAKKNLSPTSPYNPSPSPPPMPAVSPPKPPSQILTPPKSLLPQVSIPLPQDYELKVHSIARKYNVPTSPPAQGPAAAPDAAPQSVPISPEPCTNPPVKLPSLINRPFKPPKTRSSLKKSNSDTSSIRPPPALPQEISRLPQAIEQVAEDAEQQIGSAWGKEAWDLFGCGRDGLECTYKEFKRKEGLL